MGHAYLRPIRRTFAIGLTLLPLALGAGALGAAPALAVTATPARLATPARTVSPAPSPAPNPAPFPARFHPVTPARLMDSRIGLGRTGAVGPGETGYLQLAGVGPVPAGAGGVALNVTVTDITAPSYLSFWPATEARPATSSVNFAPGAVAANLVTVELGSDGRVAYYNSAGTASLIVDVEGWLGAADPSAPAAGLYRPLMPARVLDTRTALGGHPGPLGAGERFALPVLGAGNVPAGNVLAVAVNVTVTDGSAATYIQAYPSGGAAPVTSTVNATPGQTVCNRALVAVGPDGALVLFNSAGTADVIVDVAGWFTASADPAAAGGEAYLVTPARVLDTRTGLGGATGPLQPQGVLRVPLAGAGPVPAGAGSALLNVTVTNAAQPSFLAAFPGGTSLPFASDLNFVPGRQAANLQVVRLGGDGSAQIYNSAGSVDVIVDVVGYLTPAPAPSGPPGAPVGVSATPVPGAGADVAWGPPADGGGSTITSYTIASSAGGLVAAPGSAVSGFIPTGCGSPLTFTVVAVNGATSGPASAASAAITVPCTSNVIGDVPYYRQVYSLSCEAAALEMALGHQGIAVDQTRELNDMNIDWRPAYYDSSGLRWGDPYTNFVGDPNGSELWLTGYGTYSSNVARVARLYGGTVLVEGENVAPSTVYQAVLDNHPVVAWIAFDWKYHAAWSYLAFDGRSIPYAGGVEHAVTVVGVNPTSVLVYNPWDGPQWVSKSTFEAAYGTYHDMAVVMR
jgi:uncharacterized protein YvpB